MAELSSEEVRADLEKQIAELKSELKKMKESIGTNAANALHGAEDAYRSASGKAQGVARQARVQAHAVSDAIRENPGTAATVLSSAGLIGFLLGLVVGCTMASGSSRGSYFGRW